MKSKILTGCALATAILTTTIGSASSTERHGHMRVHYLHRHIAHHAIHRYARVHRAFVRRNRHERLEHLTVTASGGGYSGIASVYRGGHTANGEFASSGGLTAAHKSLPFGTMVRVTNRNTGRSVIVRINDRGPYVHGRIIDLTPAGARAIGLSGLAPVTLAVLGHGRA
ncbi:MAG TPA: septal ring lytic transglycosylase RlpA family protein [Xanthobacteraceae bacterium]|jgi:rare lipoprotein A